MSKTIVYVVALVVVTLIAGTLLGVVISRKSGHLEYGRTPGRFAQGQAMRQDKRPLEKLSEKLDLTLDQKVKLTQILKDSREELLQVQSKTREKLLEIKNKAEVRISEILTPEQQIKFDKLKSDLEQKNENGWKRFAVYA